MSAAARKQVGPPDMSSLTGGPNALLGRFGGNRGGDAPVVPAAQAPAPPRPRGKPSDAIMDRRSWYMSKAVADALAEEVDELHFATRKPKHTVLAELIAVALEHRAEALARLEARD